MIVCREGGILSEPFCAALRAAIIAHGYYWARLLIAANTSTFANNNSYNHSNNCIWKLTYKCISVPLTCVYMVRRWWLNQRPRAGVAYNCDRAVRKTVMCLHYVSHYCPLLCDNVDVRAAINRLHMIQHNEGSFRSQTVVIVHIQETTMHCSLLIVTTIGRHICHLSFRCSTTLDDIRRPSPCVTSPAVCVAISSRPLRDAIRPPCCSFPWYPLRLQYPSIGYAAVIYS